MRAMLCGRGWIALVVVFSAFVAVPRARSSTNEIKIEAQLIWGANEVKKPDPNHKPVSDEIKKKLHALPLRWTNYFVVKQLKLKIPPGQSAKAAVSERCSIEVTDLGKSNFKICLFGKGQPVIKQSQALPRDEILVLGGNAPNETAWFVVLKRLE